MAFLSNEDILLLLTSYDFFPRAFLFRHALSGIRMFFELDVFLVNNKINAT